MVPQALGVEIDYGAAESIRGSGFGDVEGVVKAACAIGAAGLVGSTSLRPVITRGESVRSANLCRPPLGPPILASAVIDSRYWHEHMS